MKVHDSVFRANPRPPLRAKIVNCVAPHRVGVPVARGPRRGGLTLIELMVVVVILVTLVAITVPMMMPMLEGREMREASRQIAAMLGTAQARAAELGRPVGVMFARSPTNANATFQLFQAEVPPPYAGDTVTARAFSATQASLPTPVPSWQAFLTESWAAAALILPGDLIKFDYRGIKYIIISVVRNGDRTMISFYHQSAHSGASVLPPMLVPFVEDPETPGRPVHPGVPFQIFRQPQRTAAAPLELPTPAVVDLQGTGVGADGIGIPLEVNTSVIPDPTVPHPVTIMFSPSGRIDRLWVRGASDVPQGPIHLMVGRVDQIGPANLKDPNSLWVSIGHRTGLITTSANYVQPGPVPPQIGPEDVALARQFAVRAQSMGGR